MSDHLAFVCVECLNTSVQITVVDDWVLKSGRGLCANPRHSISVKIVKMNDRSAPSS